MLTLSTLGSGKGWFPWAGLPNMGGEGGRAQWASTYPLLAPEASPLKTPLVLPALYAFLLAYLTDNITNQFLAKF